ncbi:hypothetical protein B296_00040962 [Ensete ventricosum]|uniref:Uncharacterized protein n=1 Tax=Ensete ventricosum TaxID=4639 RepID=A0A426Y775_ENSVE|nr:hypothetical protein B296_00040962 [Ensete ventricosum]
MCVSGCYCSDVCLEMLLFGGSCGVLHEVLVGVGGPMWPLRRSSQCPDRDGLKCSLRKRVRAPFPALSGGFIHTSWRADRTLGLTSTVRSGIVGRCSRSLSVQSAWCRDVAHHFSLIGSLCSVHYYGGQVNTLPPRLGPALVGSSWDLSTVVDC